MTVLAPFAWYPSFPVVPNVNTYKSLPDLAA